LILSLHTQNNFIRDESSLKINQNLRVFDSPMPKERLLTLTNQNQYQGNYKTHNSYIKGNKIIFRNNENTILTTAINLISPKNLPSNYKSFNDYINGPNGKYKENYASCVANLKEKFENSKDSLINNPKNIINSKNPTDGFKSYEIPHICSGKSSENFRTNLFRENLEKSIKYLKPKNEDLEELIDEENNKLKIYMDKLDAFTGLNSPKHPNLNQITKMTKLRESNLRVANSRYMGSKYDPLNYPK